MEVCFSRLTVAKLSPLILVWCGKSFFLHGGKCLILISIHYCLLFFLNARSLTGNFAADMKSICGLYYVTPQTKSYCLKILIKMTHLCSVFPLNTFFFLFLVSISMKVISSVHPSVVWTHWSKCLMAVGNRTWLTLHQTSTFSSIWTPQDRIARKPQTKP